MSLLLLFGASGKTVQVSWLEIEAGVAGATNYPITANAGSYTYTGVAATLTRSKVLAASAGSYTLAGVAATIARSKVLAGASGSYAYSGVSATLLRSKVVVASAGAYVYSGVAATVTYTGSGINYPISATAGSYTLTGVAATISKTRILTANAGAYVVSGVASTVARSRLITGLAGSYGYTGIAATIGRSKAIQALAGSYTVTGIPATVAYTPVAGAYTLFGSAGAYVVSGKDATITRTGGTQSFSQEVILKPQKWYVKRKKQILLFNSPEEADAFIESEAVAEKAIEQAQKTSRRARKRLRDKIITVTPEVVDTDYLSSLVDRFNIPVNLPSLIAQQDYDRVMQIMQLAMEMQDEEDIEFLLLM